MLSKRLYIIDDDQNFGRSLKRLLVTKGFQADYFGSAKAFLDSVPAGQKGIAVIDINMPGINGFDLMDTMRELYYEMPVIIVTGQTQDDSRDLALERGAVGFLQKPFSDLSLLDLIKEQE
jgi:FixJ family two-component response regulator